MTDPENFLSRWSRRKRNAAEEIEDAKATSENTQPARADGDDNGTHVDEPAVESHEPAFDLESLPPIESITADTDIRPFLAPGVPPELSRAALRRAWVADPKVRNFVGMADYDWDFNTPGAIAGFGPLEMTPEVRRQIARIMGEALAENESQFPTPATSATPAARPAQLRDDSMPKSSEEPSAGAAITASVQDVPEQEAAGGGIDNEPSLPQQEYSASHHSSRNRENLQTIVRRAHGRALPK